MVIFSALLLVNSTFTKNLGISMTKNRIYIFILLQVMMGNLLANAIIRRINTQCARYTVHPMCKVYIHCARYSIHPLCKVQYTPTVQGKVYTHCARCSIHPLCKVQYTPTVQGTVYTHCAR